MRFLERNWQLPLRGWRGALAAERRAGARLSWARPWLWVLLALLPVCAQSDPAEKTADARDRAVVTGAGVSRPVETENLRAQLVAERAAVAPGANVDLALVFDIRPHWHTYWKNPGDSGEPPQLTWDLPAGVTVGPIQWTSPSLIPVGPLANYGYSGRAEHLMPLSVPPDWPAGEPIDVRAEATWLVCEEHCIPEEGAFELRLETAPTAETQGAAATTSEEALARAQLFAQARAKLPSGGRIAASLERGEDQLRLRVPAAALPAQPTSVAFFADDWGLIEHAASQSWQLDGDWLSMTLVSGEAPGSAAPTGLLVIDHRGGTDAFQVDASERPFDAAASTADAAAGASGQGVQDSGAAEGAPLGLPLALLFALLGGLVLNLMPCVFPVLAIKALALAQQAQQRFAERALHGLSYSAGVLAFFALVAMLLLSLRAGGAAVGWGFQLQSPTFVVLMAYLFLALGLSLAGAITLGASLMGIGAAGPSRGYLGAFMTGALAALVAAPCTAPFMGAALGFALSQPWPAALAVVLTLGLGMALPFLVLALSPALARRLPRPGQWMEYLKQLLAFPMFATAAWLLWVLSVQTGPIGIGAGLTGLLLLALGLWLLEVSRTGRGRWQRAAQISAAVSLAAALWLAMDLAPGAPDASTEPGAQNGEAARRFGGEPKEQTGQGLARQGRESGPTSVPFSNERLAAAREAQRPVFVNMTAAWCITCLANERIALSRSAVVEAFAGRDLLYLKGDWTNRDARITDYLASFGRNGVPLYVYYPPGSAPQVLPQVLTESLVLNALQP